MSSLGIPENDYVIDVKFSFFENQKDLEPTFNSISWILDVQITETPYNFTIRS